MRTRGLALLLLGPPLAAWCLALGGCFLNRGWLAIQFRDPSFPTVPAVHHPPGVAAPDVVAWVSDAVLVLLAALVSALLVEVSKATWVHVGIERGTRGLPLASYLSLTLFQLALIHDTVRFGHFHWWSWLLWQLGIGELPADSLPASRLVAFLPSATLLVLAAFLTARYLTSVGATEDALARKPGRE